MNKLPKATKTKINKEKFMSLAKEVKKSLEEEEKYLKENENSHTSKLRLSY